ncbi:MAG: DUF3313 family protein [Gammaproteobacteria bacterium]|nr:DUF3313 family protein [Gammaproteobacteria bacterium]
MGSGFIDFPPTLTPIPNMEGAWHWNKPDVKFQNYDKVLLENIEIFLSPDSEYKGIDADQMKILSSTMRAAMIEALEPDYPVVTRIGSGVMIARIAITNVHLGKPKHQLGQYTPIGLLFGGIKKLAGKSRNLSLKNASVEAQMFDAQSGKRIAVRIDTKPLRSLTDDPDEMSWEAIEESMKVYGTVFRERVDLVRGK